MVEFSDIQDAKIFPDPYFANKSFHTKLLNRSKRLITPKMFPVNIYDTPSMHVYDEGDVASYNKASAGSNIPNDRFAFRYYLKSRFLPFAEGMTSDTILVTTHTVTHSSGPDELAEKKAIANYPYRMQLQIYQVGTDSLLWEKTISADIRWENEYLEYDGRIKDLPKELRKMGRAKGKRPMSQNNASIKGSNLLLINSAEAVADYLSTKFTVPTILPMTSASPVVADQRVAVDTRSNQPTTAPDSESLDISNFIKGFAESELTFAVKQRGNKAILSESNRYQLWVSKAGGNARTFKNTIPVDTYNMMVSYNGGSRGGVEVVHWIERTDSDIESLRTLIESTDFNEHLRGRFTHEHKNPWGGVEYQAESNKIIEDEVIEYDNFDLFIMVSRTNYLIVEQKKFFPERRRHQGNTVERVYLHVILRQPDFMLHIFKPISSRVYFMTGIRPTSLDLYEAQDVLYFLNRYVELIR